MACMFDNVYYIDSVPQSLLRLPNNKVYMCIHALTENNFVVIRRLLKTGPVEAIFYTHQAKA